MVRGLAAGYLSSRVAGVPLPSEGWQGGNAPRRAAAPVRAWCADLGATGTRERPFCHQGVRHSMPRMPEQLRTASGCQAEIAVRRAGTWGRYEYNNRRWSTEPGIGHNRTSNSVPGWPPVWHATPIATSGTCTSRNAISHSGTAEFGVYRIIEAIPFTP